ncbi:MAG: hypothetical protein WEB87_05925 [Bacteriovoracaceae bacterium]
MKLRLALEDKIMDSRIRDRLLAEGKISQKDIDAYIQNLPEESSSAYEKVANREEPQSTEQ